jgi:hypothetical protein
MLEYPIKTMNANQDGGAFQVDTGPVPFPDLDRHAARRIELLCPAYIAYNGFGYAEFVLQSPTPVGQGLWVKHFSEIRGLSATNSVFCAPPAQDRGRAVRREGGGRARRPIPRRVRSPSRE